MATGVVAGFDEAVGTGTVKGEDGRAFFFHCTAIADGTRTIAEGARVQFDVVPGRGGRWEAAAISPGAVGPSRS